MPCMAVSSWRRGRPRAAAWAQNVWYAPRRLAIASIGDAARQLRAVQRNWAVYSWEFHRRAALIQEKLPKVSAKPLRFGDLAPSAPLGAWTLLDAHTVLATAHCSSPFPNGEAQFIEDREAPPSRAYLKLWEALTVIGARPGPGDLCLDLGAAPAAGAGSCCKPARASSRSTRRRSIRASPRCPGSTIGR